MQNYSMRDVYPNYAAMLATVEKTVPESEEQTAYSEVENKGNTRVYTKYDFYKLVAIVAILAVLLALVGIVE